MMSRAEEFEGSETNLWDINASIAKICLYTLVKTLRMFDTLMNHNVNYGL